MTLCHKLKEVHNWHLSVVHLYKNYLHLGSFNKLSLGVSFGAERTYFSPFELVAGIKSG